MFLKVPKKVEYGLIALVHISSCDPEIPVSRAQIAESNRLPVELLGKVLQELNRAGLISSVQGVRGGYRLARSRRWPRLPALPDPAGTGDLAVERGLAPPVPSTGKGPNSLQQGTHPARRRRGEP